MACKAIVSLLAWVLLCDAQARAQKYTVPPAKLEAIYPQGLRVSIPDDGFSLFAFHGNLNQEMEGLEAGQWSRDITKAKNNRWTFRDRNAKLKLGDTIYFWTYVIKDGLGYRQDNGEWTVTEFVNEDGTPVDGQATLSPNFSPMVSTSGTTAPTVPTRVTTAAPPCQGSPTAVLGRTNICKGALLFNEEFEKNNIKDLVNWDPEIKFPQEPDYPFNLYMVDDTLGVENGILSVTPVLLESKYHEGFVNEHLDLSNTCTGQIGTRECKQVASGAQILPPVITGKITTRNKFNFKFGRVEIRAKLPSGNWLTPEITLEPRDKVYGDKRYESGLIRVAFTKGNAVFAKKLYGGPVLSDSEPYRSFLMKEKIGIDSWYKDFHNYSIVWKPDGMQLFVDGEQYGTVDPGEGFFNTARQNAVPHAMHWVKGSVMAPLDEMFYVALGLRVGGIHDFTDGPDKPWKNKNNKATVNFYNAQDNWFPTWYDANLKIDYVKHLVYQSPGFRLDVMAVTYVLLALVSLFYCDTGFYLRDYVVPEIKLEALYPKGLRVSIPDDGYTQFSFHGNLNVKMRGIDVGRHWERENTDFKNGSWTFSDLNTVLKLGDKIYYWAFVKKDNIRYVQGNREWTVTEFVRDQLSVDSRKFTTPPATTELVVPSSVTTAPSTTCLQSQTAVLGRTRICKGDLLFSEEFGDTDVKKLSNWMPEVMFPQGPDYPFNVYLEDGPLRLENGLLIISPVLLESKYHEGILNEALDLSNSCTGMVGTWECSRTASGAQILPPVATGKITSKNAFNFKFGRVEIRAKLPGGDWLMPEINLEPRDYVYGNTNYGSGLIRIAFAKGNSVYAKKLYGGPITYNLEPYRSFHLKKKNGKNNWSNDFHNYSLVWKPDGMELYVDGDLYGTVDPGQGFHASATQNGVAHAGHWTQGTIMAPLDTMFYVSLGIRVGGINDFDDVYFKPWKNRARKAVLNFWSAKDYWLETWSDADMKIDYVRVYAL
ncbi:Beta-1,3-glucan-binding protein [Papilio machaon]|uniref:Beta-1,3-glucan-binding protein n=1 Tax=Papilio machaon TaxID=76193 RepID=A0A0N1PIG9_PAPMA|nr:Beta-1,3-glucan-binding protein [Papilio machaon]